MKMNINNELEKIANNKNLNDIEKIKAIYVLLGNKLKYNLDYIYILDSRIREAIYEDKFELEGENALDKDKSDKQIAVVCKQVNDLLIESINRIAKLTNNDKMKAKELGYRPYEGNHVATLLNLEEENYYLDLHKDVYKIKKGMKTKYFAPGKDVLEHEFNLPNINTIKEDAKGIEFKEISEKEQKQIDEKIGYLKYGIYYEDAIEMLEKEMHENSSTKTIIDFMFENLKNKQKQDDFSFTELKAFYKKTLSILLGNEMDNVKINDVYINEKDNEKENVIYQVSIKDDKNIYNYIYDIENKNCRKIDSKEIKEKIDAKEITYKYRYNTLKLSDEER